jgi:WD40 repeat protein
VNKVKTLPGGWLLASADDAGILSLSDVRMLGSSDRDAVLWSTKACKGVVRAIDTITYESIPAARQHSFKRHHFIPGNDAAIVTGGDDGLVRLWDVNSGRLLQQSEPVYPAKPNTSSRLRSLTSGGGDAKYTVTGLDVCEEGVLSSGSDGVVRLYVRS